MNDLKRVATVFLCCVATVYAYAAAPASYYKDCENKGGKDLLTALYQTITSHTRVSYDGLWNVYKTSDVRSDGTVWDMYSTKHWRVGAEHCGNYKLVGDCINREHSFPKSWFNDASPMVSDAFHVYPTDGKVNGQRSNYPFGECAGGTRLASNGNVQALGRLGRSTFPGYSGTVFEPDDEYKGDFARSYFYMAACYNDRISGWSSDMLARNSYPVFSSWALDLLLKWHRMDPVSDKETKRNDAVYAHQRNRNPFIDHPELAEYIWGDKKSEKWASSVGSAPVINQPVSGSAIDLGVTAVNVARSVTVTVKGSNLTGNVTFSSNGGFMVSPSMVSAADANSAAGAKVTVTATPATAGDFNGTLTITSGTAKSSVSLRIRALDGLPASAATDVELESFVANWIYVGDEIDGSYYMLDVRDAGGSLDGYPRNVAAKNGSYRVDGLMPSTTYTYTLKSATMTSQSVSVTTADPIPSVNFYYDGDLRFISEPGVASEPAELLVEIENITTDVNVSVTAPFELSLDKSDWGLAVTLSPDEARVYMRLNSDKAGDFSTVLKAVAGDYINDDVIVSGSAVAPVAFFEDFETEGVNNYTDKSWQGTAAKWFLHDAGITPDSKYEGKQSVRFGKTASSYLELDEDRVAGIGTVSFYAAVWNKDGDVSFAVRYSADGGTTWNTAGTGSVTSSAYTRYTLTVNAAGPVRLRVEQTEGKRWMLDNLEMSDYRQSGLFEPDADYHRWDAYARGGSLVIESDGPREVAVYGVDGITWFNGAVSAYETVINLPKGLYVIASGDFSRRVLVK